MEKPSSSKNQFLVTFLVNLIPLSYGFNSGWMSPSIPVLLSSESPLPSGSITSDEGSWIGAALCIGGTVGNILAGWMADRYGRKVTIWISAIPQIISWILVITANNVYYLIAMRILAGFSGGVCFMLIPVIVAEIAEDRIRGLLNSILQMSFNIGVLIMYILGNYLPYEIIPWILLVPPTIFLIVFPFIPETPYYLMQQQDSTNAEKSLKFFRGYSSKEQNVSKDFIIEFDNLKQTFKTAPQTTSNDRIIWKDLVTPHARKAFLIATGLLAFDQFSGCFAMLNYTAIIFTESGSTLSANMSAIVIAFIQLTGSYTSTILVERAGRKLLLLISGTGLVIGMSVFSGFSYVKNLGYDVSSFNWLPLVCFSFIIFIASIGVLTVPYVIIVEVMPLKIKGFVITFCLTLSWMFALVSVKFFAALFTAVGMHGVLCLFAVCCLIGTLFVLFMVPETKGKSFEAIAKMMS